MSLGLFSRIVDKAAAKFGKPSAPEATKPAPPNIGTLIAELAFHADAAFGPGWTAANLTAQTRDGYNALSKKIAGKLSDMNTYAATAFLSREFTANRLTFSHDAHGAEAKQALKLLVYKIDQGGVDPAFAAKVETAHKRVAKFIEFCGMIGVERAEAERMMNENDAPAFQSAINAYAERETAKKLSAAKAQIVTLEKQIAASKAEKAGYVREKAKLDARIAGAAEEQAYLARFLGLTPDQLGALVPGAFKAKLDARIESKAAEKLAATGHNCAPVGWQPAKPRLSGIARTTEAFKRQGNQ